MLIEARDLPVDAALAADVCIVGGGPAGISLALELAAPGRKVMVLESGGLDYDDAQQDLAAGTYDGAPYNDLSALRIRALGGTTFHWGGQSLYLDPIDFERRDHVPDSGWPMDYAAYHAHVRRAAEYCGLAGAMEKDDLAHGTARAVQPPFPEGEMRHVALFLPEDGPRNFGLHFRDALTEHPDITVVLNAPVRRLVASEDQSRVSSASIETLNGTRLTATAQRFVLACGGIENARLLLLSGPQGGPGLGNRHDVVGRYFMEHPNYFLGRFDIAETEATRLLRNPRPSDTIRLDLQLTPQAQRRLGILNHSAYIVPGSSAVPHHRDMSRVSKLWRRLGGTFRHSAFELLFRFEHAPTPDSRVTLGSDVDRFGDPLPHVHFSLGALEKRTLSAFVTRFSELLGANDLGYGSFDDAEIETWAEDPGWQVHHCGGCRMGTDPTKSVVGPNCRVHGMANLYVAGSAVFPTCGHANPTMNLVALSLRMADHLKEQDA